MQVGSGQAVGASGPVRGPQSLVSGLVLIALAAFALWLTSDLPQGTLRAMGPAMLPRWLAIGVGLCGVALVIASFLRAGEALEGVGFRGPLVVVIAVLAFGATIRGFSLGSLNVPTLGLLFAGPLAIFISGFATPEARWRELVILALLLTAFCMMLFGDLLNLPIPMYPAGWSSDGRLRMTSAIITLAGVAVWLTGRRRTAREPIDVVPDEHAGTI